MTVAHAVSPVPSGSLHPNGSTRCVSSAAKRLPSAVLYGCLEDDLTVCLSLLVSDPDRFEAAAVGWHSRWCSWLCGIGFDESQAVLTALEGLAGRDPVGAAHALRATCRSYGLDEVATVLDGWIAHSRRSIAAEATPSVAA